MYISKGTKTLKGSYCLLGSFDLKISQNRGVLPFQEVRFWERSQKAPFLVFCVLLKNDALFLYSHQQKTCRESNFLSNWHLLKSKKSIFHENILKKQTKKNGKKCDFFFTGIASQKRKLSSRQRKWDACEVSSINRSRDTGF